MKIFFYSIGGDACPLAQQCAQEGHQVMLYIDAPNYKPRYEGLVWKTDDWEAAAKEADFTVFDFNGQGHRADKLREMGCKVWNGGKLADRLEMDRQFGMKVLAKAGIPVPETFHFGNGQEALAIVQKSFETSDRVVIKLDSSAGTATSYVASDREDMVSRINCWDRECRRGGSFEGWDHSAFH